MTIEELADSRKFIESLIVGSENIRRMRNEIEQVMRLILGTIALCRIRMAGSIELTYGSEKCIWTVESNRPDFIQVHCKTVARGPDGAPDYLLNATYDEIEIKGSVMLLRSELPVFVTGIRHAYPEIDKQLQTTIEAA